MTDRKLEGRSPVWLAFVLAGSLQGCGAVQLTSQQYQPVAVPPTGPAATLYSTSFDCLESASTVEKAVCTSAALAALDVTLAGDFRSAIRGADLVGRDQLLATQRRWQLGLAETCRLPDLGTAPPDAAICLQSAYRQRDAVLAAWRPAPLRSVGRFPIAQYVAFKPILRNDPALCDALGGAFDAALAGAGRIDPGDIPGATEIAGTNGPASSTLDPRHRVIVDIYDANVFASFERRARSVSLDGGPPVIDPLSLGKLVQAQGSNLGNRFSAYASQTNDYGQIDVFQYQSRLLALVADSWGLYTPANPGEFAHAGIWDISGAAAAPVCLFDTYKNPPSRGAFAELPNFSAWRDLLAQIRDSVPDRLTESARQEQAQLRRETDFRLLNMPLVALGEVKSRGWNGFLRYRHDQALDALFAWSARDPANKASFDKLFALLRPVASDLVTAYQQTEGLTSEEANQAAGLAVLELLYAALGNIAPEVGAELAEPGRYSNYKPRYPILAMPGA